MRIPTAKSLLVFALSTLLGGCLESDRPLIAGSAFSDAFAGTYRYQDLRAELAGDAQSKTVRLRKDGEDLVREDYDEAGKVWAPSSQRIRFAPYRGLKGEAIVQQNDGKSYAFLYYRAQGAGEALVWTIDCGKIPESARKALDLVRTGAGTGADCKIIRLDQAEGAIRAYLRTDPKPDLRLTAQKAGSRGGRLLQGLQDELNPLLKGAEILKNMQSITPVLDNQSSDAESDADNFGNRAAAPISQTWAALAEGDFGGAWRVIWHSWIIFALIAFVIGIVLTRRC